MATPSTMVASAGVGGGNDGTGMAGGNYYSGMGGEFSMGGPGAGLGGGGMGGGAVPQGMSSPPTIPQSTTPMPAGVAGVAGAAGAASNGATTTPTVTINAVPSVTQQRPRPEDMASHITVSDPVVHNEGLQKYTSYRVEVRGTMGGMNQQQQQQQMAMNYSAVLRRYSDFLWLFERLHKERAGAIVPPLPEKQAVGRLDPAFVEERRVQLQRFLRRVAVHPELGDSNALDTFLRADDITFSAAKNAKDSPPLINAPMPQYGQTPGMGSMMGGYPMPQQGGSSSSGGGWQRWFSETKTSLTGDLVRSPDDDLFDEIDRYIATLEDQMKEVVNQVSVLVRRGKEVANGMFELGLAFNLLGQSEADILGAALTKVGGAADSLSGLTSDHAAGEADKFEEPLRDYVKTLASVKQALQRRHERRVTFSAALQDFNSKQMALGKLRATPGQEGKAYGAEMALRRSQEVADRVREDFATVSQRVLREVDRFKREKADDMRTTVLDYIELQIHHNKKMEQVWSALVGELENMPLDKVGNIPIPNPVISPAQNMPPNAMAPGMMHAGPAGMIPGASGMAPHGMGAMMGTSGITTTSSMTQAPGMSPAGMSPTGMSPAGMSSAGPKTTGDIPVQAPQPAGNTMHGDTQTQQQQQQQASTIPQQQSTTMGGAMMLGQQQPGMMMGTGQQYPNMMMGQQQQQQSMMYGGSMGAPMGGTAAHGTNPMLGSGIQYRDTSSYGRM